MKTYLILAVANLPAGAVVALDDNQARRRAHLIEPVGDDDGVFKATHTIQFKKGETVGIADGSAGNMSKAHFECLDDAEMIDDDPGIDESADTADEAEDDDVQTDMGVGGDENPAPVDMGGPEVTEAPDDDADAPETEAPNTDANGVPYDPATHYANGAKDDHGAWKVKKGVN